MLVLICLTVFTRFVNSDININVPNPLFPLSVAFSPLQPVNNDASSVQSSFPSFLPFHIHHNSPQSWTTERHIETTASTHGVYPTLESTTHRNFARPVTTIPAETEFTTFRATNRPSTLIPSRSTQASYQPISDFNFNDQTFDQKGSTEKPSLTRPTTSLDSRINVAQQTTSPAFSTSKKPNVKRECGVQVTSNRIVGGQEAGIDEMPWLALLYYKSPKNNKLRYKCGGSFIKTRTILTAAHCVEGNLRDTLEFVRLGEWNTATEKDCEMIGEDEVDCSDPPIDLKVKDIFIHPSRNAATKTNDVALLVLEKEVPYTDFIRPICLPTESFKAPTNKKDILLVAGWGSTTQYVFVVSDIKMKLKISHVPYENCSNIYQRYNFTIDDSKQICAGGERDKGTCAGDSGGPLMYFDSRKMYVSGVVSFGTKPCAEAGVPGIFVNVWSYIDWINQFAI